MYVQCSPAIVTTLIVTFRLLWPKANFPTKILHFLCYIFTLTVITLSVTSRLMWSFLAFPKALTLTISFPHTVTFTEVFQNMQIKKATAISTRISSVRPPFCIFLTQFQPSFLIGCWLHEMLCGWLVIFGFPSQWVFPSVRFSLSVYHAKVNNQLWNSYSAAKLLTCSSLAFAKHTANCS